MYAIRSYYEAYDDDLADLADGALSKEKVEDSANWDTAHGWGDHGTNGYLTGFTETDPVAGTSVWTEAQYPHALLADGTRAMTGDLDMGGNSVSNGSFSGDAGGLTNVGWGNVAGKPVNLDTDSTDDLVDTDIGVTVQAYDADLADLADGELSKEKVEDSVV